ncbi:MAG: hypothetical protein DDT32_00715 [Syntrophomonadaceae bacterium]|nr:hypothetical protein [Bacillota bacterium]
MVSGPGKSKIVNRILQANRRGADGSEESKGPGAYPGKYDRIYSAGGDDCG